MVEIGAMVSVSPSHCIFSQRNAAEHLFHVAKICVRLFEQARRRHRVVGRLRYWTNV
jgi:hypothetical protein